MKTLDTILKKESNLCASCNYSSTCKNKDNCPDRLALEKIKEQYEENLESEKFILKFSSKFISLPLEKIDSECQYFLKHVVDYFHFERGVLLYITPDKKEPEFLYSWSVDEIVPAPLKEISQSNLPFLFKSVLSGETVKFSKPEDLLPEGRKDMETFKRRGTVSHISLPVSVSGKVTGILAMETFRFQQSFPDILIKRLTTIAEIFAGILTRKKLEADASKLREDLNYIAKNITVRELSSSFASELNQSLCASMTDGVAALQILSRNNPDLNELQEIIEDITSANKRAAHIIKELKNRTKKKEKEFKIIHINKVIQNVINLIKISMITNKIEVKVRLNQELPDIIGDELELKQVFLNLLLNGIDVIKDLPYSRRTISIKTFQNKDNVVVSLRDLGSGIDKDKMEEIFTPFYTTKSKGMGIGLSISSNIVEAHGGNLWAENNKGKGATFYVSLPVFYK